jgi:hypothetical protein
VRLISCQTDSGETLGVVAGDRWVPAGRLVPGGATTMVGLLAGGMASMDTLRDAATPGRILAEGLPTLDLRLLAPVPRPGKVVAVGRDVVVVDIERIGRLENACAFAMGGIEA